MYRIRHLFLFLLAAICLLTACKDEQSGDILSASEMEDLLYDIHVARAIVAQNPEDKSLDIKYRQAVLKKHGVTETCYEQSLAYYSRHTEEFYKIYTSLNERFEGRGGSMQSHLPFEIRPGCKDTTDIWTSSNQFLLATTGIRHVTETLKVDADFKPGDKFYLCFSSKRLARDFSGNATCLITATYEDNTHSCFSQRISGDRQNVEATLSDTKTLKQMRIDFLLNTPPRQTPQLLQINDIALIRIHKISCDTLTTSITTSTDTLASPPSDSISQAGRRLRDKLSNIRVAH